MKPVLHIVKDPNDTAARAVIAHQSRDNAYGVCVILIQDAVGLPHGPEARTCVLQEDIGKTPLSNGVEPISYPRMLDLIFESEAVTVW
jgi:hypothetical protein